MDISSVVLPSSPIRSNVLESDSGRNESFSNEHNDCTVRAYATACEISYKQAHADLFVAGRKMRRGFRFLPFAVSKGWQYFPRPKMEVEKYIQLVAYSGNWIILIRGHVFAVVNGVINDMNPAKNLKCHVKMAWKIK